MVQAVPSNCFPTFTRPNFGEIYIKIPHNSEDHIEEPRVFTHTHTQKGGDCYCISQHIWATLLRKNIQKNPLIPKDHISMDHEFCNRQLFTSCMHLLFFPHSTSHNENSCMISEKPKEYVSKGIMMGLSTMYIK